jgi:DNA-binding NarL/FixJ family response regulator
MANYIRYGRLCYYNERRKRIKLFLRKGKLHRLSQSMHNNNKNSRFKIEERRRQVASLLAQSMTDSEIAE